MNKRQAKKKLNKYKEIQLLHFKVPTDRDGRPVMDANMTAHYIEVIQSMLPQNCTAIATPFEVVNLNKHNNFKFKNKTYTIEQIEEMIGLYEKKKRNNNE